MIVCDICKSKGVTRNLSTQKELEIHKKYFHDHNVMRDGQKQVAGSCPECGSTLFFQEGCTKCLACGYTKC